MNLIVVNTFFSADLETFQKMVAAAGAMALSNPLLLNPLILSSFINAQQNTDENKFDLAQVTFL